MEPAFILIGTGVFLVFLLCVLLMILVLNYSQGPPLSSFIHNDTIKIKNHLAQDTLPNSEISIEDVIKNRKKMSSPITL